MCLNITYLELQPCDPETIELTHWGRDEMDDILQAFSNAFFLLKCNDSDLNFNEVYS